MENINLLPDDCLRMLFEYLPIKDRLQIESVCRRWRRLSKLSWSSFKRLDDRLKTWISHSCYEKNELFIPRNMLKKVIRICGKYLQAIHISFFLKPESSFERDIQSVLTKKDVWYICQNCPNIQELVLVPMYKFMGKLCTHGQGNCKNEQHKIVPLLEPHCQRLTSFGLTMDDFCDSHEEIATLFKKMKKLQSITLDNCNKLLESDALLSLPFDTLKEFSLTRTILKQESVRLLNLVISKCFELRKFCLHDGFDLNSAMKSSLAHRISLKDLELPTYRHSWNNISTITTDIAQFINLKNLSFSCAEFVDDKLLKALANNCKQIESLNITHCGNVTDAGISILSTLPKLRFLMMKGGRDNIIYPTWIKMDNLEKLDCSICIYLKTDFICDLILNKAPNLRYLNIKYSTYTSIEKETVRKAVLLARANSRLLYVDGL